MSDDKKKGAVPGKVARTLYLPDALNARMLKEAKRRGISVNTYITLAVEQAIGAAASEATQQSSSNDGPAGFDD